MATTAILELETHPDGTVGVNSIVTGNWERLDEIFGPTLDSGDSAYDAFWKAVVRDATKPTTEGSSLEWDLTNDKAHFRPGYFVAVYATSFTPDAENGRTQRIDLTGTLNFQSFNNQFAGQLTTFFLFGNGSIRNLSFPVGWVFLNSTKPTQLAASKVGVLQVCSHGVTDSDVVCNYLVEV